MGLWPFKVFVSVLLFLVTIKGGWVGKQRELLSGTQICRLDQCLVVESLLNAMLVRKLTTIFVRGISQSSEPLKCPESVSRRK